MEDAWMQRQLAVGFQKNFSEWKGKRIAVYGLGKNAERVLTYCTGFDFPCVVARDHIGTTFCERPVVALADAVRQTDGMIIAATPKATQEVFRRIEPHLPQGYPVMDRYGFILTEQADAEDAYWGKTLESLKREIDAHDVISFDVFDTLLMRKTLVPRDVFALMERELRAQGEDVLFAEWRPAGEVEQLEKGAFPNIDAIYQYMKEHHALPDDTVQRWKAREMELEEELLVPRNDMVEAFNYAKRQGKTVCLTSDMYYSKFDMARLLASKGIMGAERIFVSCDWKSSKGNGGLFRPLVDFAEGRSILHIGDNANGDGTAPRALGIDTYLIRKATDVLAVSSCASLSRAAATLDDRLLLGMALAKACNSPFCLAETKGRVCLKSTEDLAWLCFVPMTIKYLQFILQTVREQKNPIVLFASRDGYFFQKAYAQLAKNFPLPPSVYFYTSRQALYGAQLSTEDDIVFMLDYFDRDKKSNLKAWMEFTYQIPFDETFDCTVEEAEALWGKAGLRAQVLAHADEILQEQAKKRKAYQNYLQTLHLEQWQTIDCVDMASKGTVSFGLRKMLHRPVELIAMAGNDPASGFLPDEAECHLMLGFKSPVSPLSIWLYPLEIVYASRQGQLKEFSPDGTPVFVEGTQYRADFLDDVQNIFQEAAQAFPESGWLQGELSERFCTTALSLLSPRYTDVAENVMEGFSFFDPFDQSVADSGFRYNLLRRLRKQEA